MGVPVSNMTDRAEEALEFWRDTFGCVGGSHVFPVTGLSTEIFLMVRGSLTGTDGEPYSSPKQSNPNSDAT